MFHARRRHQNPTSLKSYSEVGKGLEVRTIGIGPGGTTEYEVAPSRKDAQTASDISIYGLYLVDAVGDFMGKHIGSQILRACLQVDVDIRIGYKVEHLVVSKRIPINVARQH